MKCSNIAATKYYAIPEGFDKESVVQIKCVGVNAFVLSVDDKDIEVDFQRTGHNLYSIIINNKSYEIDMCNGPLFGKILLFTLPLMLSGILQLLFNAADVVVVGSTFTYTCCYENGKPNKSTKSRYSAECIC